MQDIRTDPQRDPGIIRPLYCGPVVYGQVVDPFLITPPVDTSCWGNIASIAILQQNSGPFLEARRYRTVALFGRMRMLSLECNLFLEHFVPWT